jgi:hypothetical protein
LSSDERLTRAPGHIRACTHKTGAGGMSALGARYLIGDNLFIIYD